MKKVGTVVDTSPGTGRARTSWLTDKLHHAPVKLDVDRRNLSFEYTAMSLLEPKNLRFRYRLDPYDPGWVDAGNRRTAFYTRVPPGSYTFRVQAASPDADFAPIGSVLPVSLAFEPWETLWFRLGLVLLTLTATAALIVWWSRRVKARAEELEAVVAERTSTLRERERLRRQVRVLSAEGRLSAWILGGLPPLFFFYLVLVRHEYVSTLWTDPIGVVLLIFLVINMAVGALWLRKVIQVEV